MATIQIKTLEGTLDTFDFETVDNITVYKPFDVAAAEQSFKGDIAIHHEHLGHVPKSGRVLQVYVKCPTTGKYSAHYYNADQVSVIPCI